MLNFLFKKSTGNVLAILAVLIFLVLGLIRLHPFNNELQQVLSPGGDDWLSYAKAGLDIKHNGLLMPSVKGVYAAPAGFLYSYFLALCFLLFGENTVPAYLIQHLFMGLSVAFVYWAFRDKMRTSTGFLFLGALFLFTLADVYKYYAVRFLSENLMCFTISLFFFCFVRGFEKNNLKLQLISAFLMGITVLTRPNVVLFPIVLIFVITPFYLRRKKAAHLLLFIAVLGLSSSFLGVRNYLVCGKWRFLPDQGTSAMDLMSVVHPIPESVDLSRIDANPVYNSLKLHPNIPRYIEYIRQKPLLFLDYYFKKVLFTFGFTRILVPFYKWRPHWMLMWLGYFIYLFLHFRERKKMQFWEVSVHLYLACYYGLIIAYAVIAIYGFRFLIPGTNFVLIFPFLAWDKLLALRRQSLEAE